MPGRIPRPRGRPRPRRGRKLASLDYHRFKLRAVVNLQTDATGLSRTHINMYNLSNFVSVDGDVSFAELEEKNSIKNLFDTYRMQTIRIKYFPLANVQAPEGLPPTTGATISMPPLYVVMDSDAVGLIANDKTEFITRKYFKIRDATRPFTLTFKVPWQYNANAQRNGYINLQDEQNNFEGGIYLYQPDSITAMPPNSIYGTLMIDAIIEMKDRQ